MVGVGVCVITYLIPYLPPMDAQVRQALGDAAKKDGVADMPDTMFTYHWESTEQPPHHTVHEPCWRCIQIK